MYSLFLTNLLYSSYEITPLKEFRPATFLLKLASVVLDGNESFFVKVQQPEKRETKDRFGLFAGRPISIDSCRRFLNCLSYKRRIEK
ncbi:hypothetical protein ABMB67_000704 [Halalkalibacter oceani]